MKGTEKRRNRLAARLFDSQLRHMGAWHYTIPCQHGTNREDLTESANSSSSCQLVTLQAPSLGFGAPLAIAATQAGICLLNMRISNPRLVRRALIAWVIKNHLSG